MFGEVKHFMWIGKLLVVYYIIVNDDALQVCSMLPKYMYLRMLSNTRCQGIFEGIASYVQAHMQGDSTEPPIFVVSN